MNFDNFIKSKFQSTKVQRDYKRKGDIIMTVDLKAVEAKAVEFNNDLDALGKELKRVQSLKCRLKKQKGKSTYEAEMQECLSLEQVLKEARQLIDPKEKPVTRYTQNDVDQLTYDEAEKAKRSIQSKKSLTRWLTTNDGDNDEYREACRIEAMILKRLEEVKPLDETVIRKTDLQTIIDTIEESGEVSQEKILEMLKSLM